MKLIKSVAIAIFALLCLSMPGQAFARDNTFGVKTGYVSRNKSALAGIYFQYGFSEHFRLAPSAECVFRRDNRDAFIIDLDAQFPFSVSSTSGKSALYPIAGVTYASWNRHLTKEESKRDDDVSTRTGRFGLNLGAGFELKVSPTLKLSLEAKYGLVKANSAFQLSLGIGYVF